MLTDLKIKHRNDPCLKLIDTFLGPPKEASVVDFPQLPHVHVRKFAKVSLLRNVMLIDRTREKFIERKLKEN